MTSLITARGISVTSVLASEWESAACSLSVSSKKLDILIRGQRVHVAATVSAAAGPGYYYTWHRRRCTLGRLPLVNNSQTTRAPELHSELSRMTICERSY
eukprot:scpid48147/ scgid28879/ 